MRNLISGKRHKLLKRILKILLHELIKKTYSIKK